MPQIEYPIKRFNTLILFFYTSIKDRNPGGPEENRSKPRLLVCHIN